MRRLKSDASGFGICPLGRAGQKSLSEENTRRCIVTGETKSRADLIRFVLSPDGTVVPDLAEKLPGRGLWVSADKGSLVTAEKKNPYSRAAKSQATVPKGLAKSVEDLLRKRVIELISLARRSGGAICGFEKIKSALTSDGVAVLIQAQDGSEQQKRKLRPPKGRNTYISCLTASELGLAFGRDYVIHAALAGGGLTKAIKQDAARLVAIIGEDAITEAKAAR